MTFYREKKVTTKKPHRCFGCWRKFPAGTKMTYSAGMSSEGEFGTHYVCDTCHGLMGTMKNEDVAELMPGDLYDEALKEEANANRSVVTVQAVWAPDGVPDGDSRVRPANQP